MSNSFPRFERERGKVRKFMYLIDMGRGRVHQPTIEKWEGELADACRAFSEAYHREEKRKEKSR